MTLKFILNKYGNKELLVDGFLYTRQYNGKKEITWRCKSYESHGCSAKAYTTNDSRTGSLRLCGTHVHPGDPVGIAKQKVLSKLRSRAQKSSDNTKSIVARCISNVPSPVAAALPRVESMRRQVQRVRHDVRPYLATPKSVYELILPDEFTRTWKGDKFLLYDSGGKNRILIFTTDKNLNYLASCPVILCDGTFYSVPSIFAQLYTFHGLNESGKTLPVVYVLMSNRRLASYVKVLNVLLQLKPEIKPVKILIDFENAFVKAVHEVFPDSIVCGCNFHFNQCVWRNVQCNGLSILYNNDINYSTGIRMLAALAFVPICDLDFAFNSLCQSQFFVDNADELEPLLEYFKSTWLGIKSTRGYRKPLFEHIMWNCYDRVICDQPRTQCRNKEFLRPGQNYILRPIFIDIIYKKEFIC
ncbi:hypothetical protein HCN44_007052 [Aphidius gifuensis]|uniref:FLYWCH-type domain-containing protein n=1 Tax=Aphidius gifuensis TaxID=684658 RepID=A0A835CWX6_APHGI|nr:hypothetical protein HCN44_007052 [Aphidius gifuensis]